jgi:hypothetical protein
LGAGVLAAGVAGVGLVGFGVGVAVAGGVFWPGAGVWFASWHRRRQS